MIAATSLLKVALEKKTAFLLEGAGIGALVGANRPDSIKRKGHGASRAALTGLGTGAGALLGAGAGVAGSAAMVNNYLHDNPGIALTEPSVAQRALILGAPIVGALGGGLLGHHLSKDRKVDQMLEEYKNKHHPDEDD